MLLGDFDNMSPDVLVTDRRFKVRLMRLREVIPTAEIMFTKNPFPMIDSVVAELEAKAICSESPIVTELEHLDLPINWWQHFRETLGWKYKKRTVAVRIEHVHLCPHQDPKLFQRHLDFVTVRSIAPNRGAA